MRTPSLNWRRLTALVRKESLQIVRDPSAILIAFVLPVIMLFLFAFAMSLDVRHVPIALVVESDSAAAHDLAAAFAGSRYFIVTPERDRRTAAIALVAGSQRGFVVIPADFDRRLEGRVNGALIQIVTDGAAPNTASFVSSYAQSTVALWRSQRARGPTNAGGLVLEPRYWFNAELESRQVFIPGAIAIIITMIGTLLTALVVAREWERGTMEALISTPTSMTEILIGKLIPYFVLGLVACLGSALIATLLLGVPLRGSWFALLVLSAAFLIPSLGQGLLISALVRNQFLASMISVFAGFLPAFLLSGMLYEIDAMPGPIQAITTVVAARYFVLSLQTLFLAGDVWTLFAPNMLAMLAIGAGFLLVARLRSHKSLDA